MRRSLSRGWAGLCGLALLAPGCGKDPFSPPSRSKAAAKAAASLESKPNFLVMIVPTVPQGDVEVWAMRAQIEANDKRAVFRVMGPAPTETPAQQPEAVRRALKDGATALIIYPGDAPDLPKALAEAEASGVPVVLIDKGLAAPEGAKPFTIVEHPPFDETARKIVAATIEDLKKASRPVDGTALLVVDKLTDGTSARRDAALKAAAEAAKFRQVVTVTIDGADQPASKAAVLEAIKANPDVSVILTDDGEGLVVGAMLRAELKGKPIFFVGGYTDYRFSPVMSPPARESCHVEGRFSELGGLAVLTALGRIRGKPAGEHAYLTPRFTKTEGAVSTEQDPKTSFPQPIRKDQYDATVPDVPVKKEAPKEGTPKPQ